MDINRLLDSSPLSIECPHCSHTEEDNFEVLQQSRIESIHCAHCGAQFQVAAMECLACGEEWLFEWTSEPSIKVIARLSCGSCGRSYNNHEEPAAATLLA
jgi:transcription elongation factor Elf1